MDIHIPCILGDGLHILGDCRRGSISVLIRNQISEWVDNRPRQLALAATRMNVRWMDGARYQATHCDNDGQCLIVQCKNGGATHCLVRAWCCTKECLYCLRMMSLMHIATGYCNSLSRRRECRTIVYIGLLNWRMLSTDLPCHLRDPLKPMPHRAFPPSQLLEEGEDEERDARASSNVFIAGVSSEAPARLRRLIVGDLANRTARIVQYEPEEQEVIALLGLSLTSCQLDILRLLLAHPLLSDEELAAFLGLQRKSVRCSLYGLHRYGCLEPIPIDAGKRWRLCERGLRLMAAASHMSVRNITAWSDDEADRKTSTRAQRGETWLLQHIQHTAGIYGFFASLAQAAKQQPEQELCWWETGASCERRYQVHEQWHNLRPDALAEYRAGSQQMRFWLEWDRGTMNVRDLAVKFDAYAHYLASREWARERSALPRLLCVAPDIAQERRMQRVAQARLAHTPGLLLWTTTGVLLQGEGPAAPIWLRAVPQSERSVQAGGLCRRDPFGAIPGKSST